MGDAAPTVVVARQARRGLSDSWFAWVMIAPAMIFIGIIVAWPLLETIRLSFTDADLGSENWVGTANYEKLFASSKFMDVIGRTFLWMALSVSLKLIVGLIGAALLAAAVPGRALFRALIMPPWVIPIAIGCIGWLWLYNGQFGFVAGMAQRLGIIDGPMEFLAYKNSAFISAIVTDVWVGTPMVSLFFLAAMQGVSRDLYEAAWVDGAGRWYRFRRITIPQIMPVIVSMSLGIFLAVNMFTGAVLLIPLYRVMRTLGLLNTYWAMIIPGVAFLIPTGIWLLRGYLEKIPRELEEAAFVDGASRIHTLRRVVLPLAVPGLIVVGVSVFIGAYAQQYLFAVTFNQVPELQPLPAGLNQFIGYQTVEWNQMMAAALTGVLPVMVVFLFLQKYLVAGLTAGAVKE